MDQKQIEALRNEIKKYIQDLRKQGFHSRVCCDLFRYA